MVKQPPCEGTEKGKKSEQEKVIGAGCPNLILFKIASRYASHLSETVAAKVEIDFQVVFTWDSKIALPSSTNRERYIYT